MRIALHIIVVIVTELFLTEDVILLLSGIVYLASRFILSYYLAAIHLRRVNIARLDRSEYKSK